VASVAGEVRSACEAGHIENLRTNPPVLELVAERGRQLDVEVAPVSWTVIPGTLSGALW
jgi:hypothetical protein